MPGAEKIRDNVHRYFATTVALVTTSGKRGRNVMAAEWAMQVSYEPMLVAVFIHDSPTLWNIKETGAFGINIAADDQADLVNIAGGYSGTEMAKLEIPGTFQTRKGSRVPMIEGCALGCECKAVSVQQMGDHVMVVGEAVSATFDEVKSPLVYTRGSYRKIGVKLASGRKTIRLSPEAFSEFKRMSAGQFVLKAAVAVVARGDGKKKETLFSRAGSSWMLPATVPDRGADYGRALSNYLASSMGVQAQVGKILGIERVMLKSGRQSLRANFVVFSCTAGGDYAKRGKESRPQQRRWSLHPPRNLLLKSLLSLAGQEP